MVSYESTVKIKSIFDIVSVASIGDLRFENYSILHAIKNLF